MTQTTWSRRSRKPLYVLVIDFGSWNMPWRGEKGIRARTDKEAVEAASAYLKKQKYDSAKLYDKLDDGSEPVAEFGGRKG